MKYESTIHFIKQIYKNVDHVLLHAPAFIGNEKKYLDDCIDTTFVSSVGKYVDRFEDAIAKYTGANRAVVCVNGTMALFMALKLCDIKPDEKVITQPLTFIATANAIAYCYAHPVFLDVDEDTMGLSPTKVRLWLERNAAVKSDGCYDKHSGKKIRAVVPMHTFGHPVKIDDFVKLCDEWKLALIEDAAESIGSFYKGRHTGTYGEIGCMSFNGNKTITCGGGGILLFQNKEKGDYAKHFTTQAKIPHRWEFKHDAIGYNLRMPNINAALGCAQLECIDTILANKRETSRMYKDFFSNIDDISFFDEPKDCKSNFWLNAVLLRDKRERDIFLAETNDNGIQTRPIWELMNRLPMFISATRGDLSTAEMFADRIVNIPSGYRK